MQRRERRFQQYGDGWLAHPTKAQRGHGDAELAAGEIGLNVAQDRLHHPSADPVLLGKGVDAETTRFYQREFGGDKERIRGKEEDRQQQIDDGGTHLAAMVSAGMRKGVR